MTTKEKTMSGWKTNPRASLPIPCTKCGHKQTVLISKLRKNPKLKCTLTSCRHQFTVDGSQLNTLMKAFERGGR